MREDRHRLLLRQFAEFAAKLAAGTTPEDCVQAQQILAEHCRRHPQPPGEAAERPPPQLDLPLS